MTQCPLRFHFHKRVVIYLSKGASFWLFQIIIDESGMCPEPHCLVPIIANKAQQVVLIGDHKQLRPIIKCREAAELGLEKSLFENIGNRKVHGV